MDDTKSIKLDFKGRTIKAKPVAEDQIVAVLLAKESGDSKELIAVIGAVMESRVGKTEWAAIKRELAVGKIKFSDITDAINTLIEAGKKPGDDDE